MESLAKTLQEAIEVRQVSPWKNPETGVVRYYPSRNIARAVVGLEVERQKTGMMTRAQMNGLAISNAQARDVITSLDGASPFIEEGEVKYFPQNINGVDGRRAVEAVAKWLESLLGGER